MKEIISILNSNRNCLLFIFRFKQEEKTRSDIHWKKEAESHFISITAQNDINENTTSNSSQIDGSERIDKIRRK